MEEISSLSEITLNVKYETVLLKDKNWQIDWKKQQYSSICSLQKTYLKYKDTKKLKMKGWQQIFHANDNQKRASWLYSCQTKQTKERKLFKRHGKKFMSN